MSEGNCELPTGWANSPLKDLIAQDGLFNDGDWVESKDQDPNGDIRLIQLADIGDGVFRDRSERFLTAAKAQELQCTFLRAGDVLISRLADPLGRACIFPEQSQPCVTAVDVCIFRSGQGGVDQNWLMHFINSTYFRNEIELRSSGTTRTRISRKNLGEIEMRVPPLAEQWRIVAKIEALQERSWRAQEALAEVGSQLEQFRQSILAAAFRGDLTANWRAARPNVEHASELLHRIRAERRRWEQAELAKYKAKGQKSSQNWQGQNKETELVEDVELPDLPSEWKWVTVEEVAAPHRHSLSSGPFGSNLGKKDYVSIGVPVIRGQNIQVGSISGDFVYVTESKADELERSMVRPGDVVLIAVGSSGRPATVPNNLPRAVLSQNCNKVTCDVSIVSPTYLTYYLQSSFAQRLIGLDTTDTVRKFFSLTNFKKIAVPLAPLAEQQKILEILNRSSGLESEVAEQCSASLAELDQLDQSILAKAFRGELVPQDPSDEPASALLARIREQRAQQAEAAKGTKKTTHMQRKDAMRKKLSELSSQHQPLAEVLTTKGKPMSPEQLLTESGYDDDSIEDFYWALREEIAKGRIRENKLTESDVLLEAVKP